MANIDPTQALLQELIASQARNGGQLAPELVLQEFAAAQAPFNPATAFDPVAELAATQTLNGGTVNPLAILEEFAAARQLANPVNTAATIPSKENGYYIPEFPESAWNNAVPTNSSPAIPTQGPVLPASFADERAARMAAEYGAQGFTFEVDPITGQTTISNTEATRAAARTDSTLTTPTTSQAHAPTAIRSSLAAIQAETDPTQRATMFGQLQAQAATFKAGLYNDALKQAEAKLGVPALEAQLRESEALDRAHPLWQQYKSDSKTTEGIRDQLLQQRSGADGEAKRMLMGNTSLAAIDAQMTAATAVFNRLENLQAQSDTRAFNNLQRREDAIFNKQFNQQLEDQELVQQTSPEMMERMQILDPSFAGKDAVTLARYINKGVRDAAVKEALLAPTEALPELSFLGRNMAAERVLIAKEAALTGQDPAVVRMQVEGMRKGMMDDKQIDTNLRLIYGADAEAIKGAKMQLQQGLLGTKASKEAATFLRYQVVQAAAQRKAQSAFLNDVGTWGIIDPELQAAIQAAKSTAGNADATDVFAAYVGSTTGPERTARMDAFLAMMERAAEPRAKSLLSPVDSRAMRQQLIGAINKQSLLSIFSGGGQAIMANALTPMPLLNNVMDFFGVSNDVK